MTFGMAASLCTDGGAPSQRQVWTHRTRSKRTLTTGSLALRWSGAHPRDSPLPLVIPAQAGIQSLLATAPDEQWIPAFAGMTIVKDPELGNGLRVVVGDLVE